MLKPSEAKKLVKDAMHTVEMFGGAAKEKSEHMNRYLKFQEQKEVQKFLQHCDSVAEQAKYARVYCRSVCIFLMNLEQAIANVHTEADILVRSIEEDKKARKGKQ